MPRILTLLLLLLYGFSFAQNISVWVGEKQSEFPVQLSPTFTCTQRDSAILHSIQWQKDSALTSWNFVLVKGKYWQSLPFAPVLLGDSSGCFSGGMGGDSAAYSLFRYPKKWFSQPIDTAMLLDINNPNWNLADTVEISDAKVLNAREMLAKVKIPTSIKQETPRTAMYTRIWVDLQGQVLGFEVLEEGHPLATLELVKILPNLLFEPAKINGVPVITYTELGLDAR